MVVETVVQEELATGEEGTRSWESAMRWGVLFAVESE